METPNQPSKAALWTGRILSGLVILFLLVDAGMKVVRAQVSVDGTVQMGYSDSLVIPIGATLLIFTILHVIPKTSVLGALLLTAYFGAAADASVRAGMGVYFPAGFCTVMWIGFYLREPRLKGIIPVVKD